MAKKIRAPRPLAPELRELLEFAVERLRTAEPGAKGAAALEVARLERAVAFWSKEDARTEKAYREFTVTLVVDGRYYESDPLIPRFWEFLLADLLTDPTRRGVSRFMLYAFPLRRLRNWRLWAAITRPYDVADTCRQLLGKAA